MSSKVAETAAGKDAPAKPTSAAVSSFRQALQKMDQRRAVQREQPRAEEDRARQEAKDAQPVAAPVADASDFQEALREAQRQAEREAQRQAQLEAQLEAQRQAERDAQRPAERPQEEAGSEDQQPSANPFAEALRRQEQLRAAREAERQAELDAQLYGEEVQEEQLREVRMRVEREVQLEAEREAQCQAERQAQLRAQREAEREEQRRAREAELEEQRQAQLEAEREERRQAQLEARREAQLRARREAQLRARREAQLDVEGMAQLVSEREEGLRAEREAQERFHEQLQEEEEEEEEQQRHRHPRPAAPASTTSSASRGAPERRGPALPGGQSGGLQPAAAHGAPRNRFEEAIRRQQERARARQGAEEARERRSPEAGAEAEAEAARAGVAEEAEAVQMETALFDVDGKVLEMQVRRGATAHDVAQIWEKEWGVSYASRLKFGAPKGSGRKWLNAREDPMPTAPAEVCLSGIGSILRAVRLALVEHGGAANAPPEPPPQPRHGPRCPGTYIRLPEGAKIDDGEMDVLALLGANFEGDAFDDTSDVDAGRGGEGRGGEGRGGESRVEAASGRAAAPAQGAEDPGEGEATPEAAVLLYVFGLVGFQDAEAKLLIERLKLSDIKHFSGIAKTQDQAQALAKEAGLMRAIQQARFAEAWRRCSLHLIGHQREYPRALARPVYEIDFADTAVAYLTAVRDAMQSEEFEIASAELKDDWRRRVPKPTDEEKWDEHADMCFKNVHSQLLALFGFFPDKKGFKDAQARVRQMVKDKQDVRQLWSELFKMSMRHFEV